MKGKYRKARLQLARGFKFSLILALSAVLSVAGCFSMENTELTELRLDKAQTLYDQGQKEEAIRLILENPSVDPLIQGRRNWMLTEMLGLTSSGMTRELRESSRVILEEGSSRPDWELLSVSTDRTVALVDRNGLTSTDICLMDLSDGEILAVYNEALQIEEEEDSDSEREFTGGRFINNEEILLWAGKNLCKFHREKGTEIIQKAELGSGPREYEKDEYGKIKLTAQAYYPSSPDVLDIRSDQKLYVLMNCGVACVDPETLRVEKQALSNDLLFHAYTGFDVLDEKVLISCRDLNRMETDREQTDGAFQIDFTESSPEIEVLKGERTLGALWGMQGDYYLLEPADPEEHDFVNTFTRTGRFELQLVRYEGHEEKSRSRCLDLRYEQLSVQPVHAKDDRGNYICCISGDEVFFLNPQSLETETRIQVQEDVYRFWKEIDGSLTVQENNGILEALLSSYNTPVTLFSNSRFTDFVQSENGSWTGIWKDGFISGTAKLDLNMSENSLPITPEKTVRGADFLTDSSTGQQWRLLFEEDTEYKSENDKEKQVILELGKADENRTVWSQKFLVTDQPADDSDVFDYEPSPTKDRPLMDPQFQLGQDEQGVFAEYVIGAEAGRVYAEDTGQTVVLPVKERICTAAIAPGGGEIAVSTPEKTSVYSFDSASMEYSETHKYEELCLADWTGWNFDQSILISQRSQLLSFLNLETGEIIHPAELMPDRDQGVPFAESVYSSYDLVPGTASNRILVKVRFSYESLDDQFWVVDLETGDTVARLNETSLGGSCSDLSNIRQMSFCEEDSRIIYAMRSGDIGLWSVEEQKTVFQRPLKTFQKAEPMPGFINAEGVWAVANYDDGLGYEIDSGSHKQTTALFRIDKDILVPWMSFTGESYYVFPDEQKAVVHGRGGWAQIELPLQSDTEAAAREYLAEKEKSKITETGT